MVSSSTSPRRRTPGLRPVAGENRAKGPSRALRQRNHRVEAYRELVRPIALHYARCTGECGDDLVQVGLMGLIRAAELYRADRAIPFAAFARPHIRGAILHYLRDIAPSVRLPRRQAERMEQMRRALGEIVATGAKPPTDLPRRLGVSEEQWRLLLQLRALRRPSPLVPELQEVLAAPPPPEGGEESIPPGRVERMLAELEPRQRLVVRRVVLGGWSYRRLGAEMNVSPMTVQRLLQRGLERLRRQAVDGGLTPAGWEEPADRAASAPRAC